MPEPIDVAVKRPVRPKRLTREAGKPNPAKQAEPELRQTPETNPVPQPTKPLIRAGDWSDIAGEMMNSYRA